MISRRTLLKTAAVVAATQAMPSQAVDASKLVSAEFSRKLVRKTIPSSGNSIPVIGIGANQYGVRDDPQALARLQSVLTEFSKVGNGVIDTAPQYGRSEKVLGSLIRKAGLRDDFFVATKCDTPGGKVTRAQVSESKKLLKSGRLDLVAVHNLRNWQQQLEILNELKTANKIKHLGVTTANQSQHDELEKIMLSQALDFVQLNYSIMDRTADKRLLDVAADRGVAVMVNVPFARSKFFHRVIDSLLPTWAEEIGVDSWAQFALKYIVSHPAVTCAIPGTRTPKHLNDNLRAATGVMPSAKQRLQMEQYFDQL